MQSSQTNKLNDTDQLLARRENLLRTSQTWSKFLELEDNWLVGEAVGPGERCWLGLFSLLAACFYPEECQPGYTGVWRGNMRRCQNQQRFIVRHFDTQLHLHPRQLHPETLITLINISVRILIRYFHFDTGVEETGVCVESQEKCSVDTWVDLSSYSGGADQWDSQKLPV